MTFIIIVITRDTVGQSKPHGIYCSAVTLKWPNNLPVVEEVEIRSGHVIRLTCLL